MENHVSPSLLRGLGARFWEVCCGHNRTMRLVWFNSRVLDFLRVDFFAAGTVNGPALIACDYLTNP